MNDSEKIQLAFQTTVARGRAREVICEWIQEFHNVEHMDEQFKTNVPRNVNYLICWYGYGSYCGSSYVLYEKDGKFYENHASHCSCMGLEDQWEPDEVSLTYLIKKASSWQEDLNNIQHYDTNIYDGESEYKVAFIKIINILRGDNK